MIETPEPLTPPYCDLTGTDWMPLHGHRLFKSDFYLRSSDAEKVVAMELWWASWFQVPAASLPGDDVAIAKLAGYGRDLKGWEKIRDGVMHGFVLCNDGRYYHRFLAQEAVTAYGKILKSNVKRQTDRDRLQAWRDAKRKEYIERNGDGNTSETSGETQNETRFVGGIPYLTLPNHKKEREAKASPKKVGCRIPDDWAPSADDAAYAKRLGLDVHRVAEDFRGYWRAKAGKDAVKLDWSLTWQGWCRREADKHPKPAPGKSATGWF